MTYKGNALPDDRLKALLREAMPVAPHSDDLTARILLQARHTPQQAPLRAPFWDSLRDKWQGLVERLFQPVVGIPVSLGCGVGVGVASIPLVVPYLLGPSMYLSFIGQNFFQYGTNL